MTFTRTVIVTGAVGGIGSGVAMRLTADGFALAVVDLDETLASNCSPSRKAVAAVGAPSGSPLSSSVVRTRRASPRPSACW